MYYSFERPAKDVREYVEENFKLAASNTVPEETSIAAESQQKEENEARGPTADTESDEERVMSYGSEHEGAVVPDRVDTQDVDPPEPADEQETDVDGGRRRTRTRPKPSRPEIMERYAKSQGFGRDGNDRFFGPDGSWIARTNGASFPWERRTASGNHVRYYWPKDHCLEREPLQLEADIWRLIDQHPESYAVILSDIEGQPVEITGTRLRAMCDDGEVTLYPATYRLVYGDDGHA